MLKLFLGLIFAYLSIVLTGFQAHALSIMSKTEVNNGVRTLLCIDQQCETFEGALSAGPVNIEHQPLIIEVKYLGDTKKLFNWNERKFL